MKTQNQNIDFSKSVKVSVDIQDLEQLGWNFYEFYRNTHEAHHSIYKEEHQTEDPAYDMNVAESDVQTTYHIDITVDDDGKTSWCLTNTEKASNGIWEGSDKEDTGDDEQTIKDLEKLHNEGKLFNIITEYYGS